jgi:hypothetical protein
LGNNLHNLQVSHSEACCGNNPQSLHECEKNTVPQQHVAFSFGRGKAFMLELARSKQSCAFDFCEITRAKRKEVIMFFFQKAGRGVICEGIRHSGNIRL